MPAPRQAPLCVFWILLLAAFPLHAGAQSPDQWQQEVHYTMDIRLHADAHQYTGHQRLIYTNHSPDTLRTVYYHLYFNAFRPESMMAERNRHVPDPDGRIVPRIFNLKPDEQGYHRVRSLTQDGADVSFDVTDTVMRVALAEPIPPGASTTFEMRWRAQIPLQTRRSGRDSRGGGIDFSMSQWYPKLAEYDERGWHADPYVMREFYAPYGTFDVRITAPAEYTLGATGILQNPETVGHGYDLSSPDGRTTWRPEDGIPDADSLTWRFLAADVHDFAWAADPDYVHDKVEADGVTHHILYTPDVADSWERLADDMPRITRYFNQELGPYPYPQMTVAQGGDGGMEYPMFTLVAGYANPGFQRKDGPLSILGTTVHEFAHMWYYAALGTNESDYAWMDEGFTTYATELGMAHLLGRTPRTNRFRQSIVRMHELGLEEPFDTPADWFQTNAAYGITAYSGGAMTVDMLGYVIGDDARDRWLTRYLRERRFRHPDPFDLELFAEQESGLKLDWYFWQFTDSTRPLDDALDEIEHTETADGFEVELELERKGEAVMPHDVKLTLADGSTQWVHVPLMVMHGHKPVPDDWIVAEPWPWVYPEHEFTLTVPARVVSAELDPMQRTPDVNRLNNTLDVPIETRFLRPPPSTPTAYGLGVRPLAGYATSFGPGVGVQVRGAYRDRYESRAMLTLWPQVIASGGDDPALDGQPGAVSPRQQQRQDAGTWFSGIDYELGASVQLNPLGGRTTLHVIARKHLGLLENRVELERSLGSLFDSGTQRLSAVLTHQYNPDDRVFRYGQLPIRFNSTRDEFFTDGPTVNPFLRTHNASALVRYAASGNGDRLSAELELGGSLDAGAVGASSANRFALEAVKTRPLGPLTARAAVHLALGADDLLLHKQARLGGTAIEEQWRTDAVRSVSALWDAPESEGHVVQYGTAGPVAYLRSAGNSTYGVFGPNVVAGRVSLHATPFSGRNALAPLGLEVFSGLGETWASGAFLAGFRGDDLLADAGLGVNYNVAAIPHLDRWTAQSDVLSDLNVIARFPLYASDPDRLGPDENEIGFRWLIGVQVQP